MAGGWESKSETGPGLPQDAAPEKDHGAAKLSKMVQSHPNYTHGTFLDDSANYKVDRKNVDQTIPTVDRGTQTGKKGSDMGGGGK